MEPIDIRAVSDKPKLSVKTVLISLVSLLLIGLIVAGLSVLVTNFFNPEDPRFIDAILRFGLLGLTIYVSYIALAAIIVPLPTLPVDVVLLSVANPYLIIGLRLTGGLIGSAVAFYLARVYGRPFLKKIFSDKTYQEIDGLSHHLSWWHFLLISMFPLMNTEIMAYVAGLGRLKLWVTLSLLAMALGYRLLIVAVFVIR